MTRLRATLALLLLPVLAGAPLAAQSDSLVRRPFSFAVLGHIRGGPSGALNPKLSELVARVRELRPDFVVLTGDIVWGDAESNPPDPARVRRQWELVDSALGGLGVPVYRVPGNHDISDLGTKRLWWTRYGALPAVLERHGSRLLLLASAWVPADDDSVPRRVTRPSALDAAQQAWLRDQLARPAAEHVFVLLHHLLWWDADAHWWREVHPLLARAGVRLVIGGDFGPLKFSHLLRDSVRYLHTAIENLPDLQILRDLETSRILSAQFDNFLLVRVNGPEVAVAVHTVAELSAPQFAPEYYTAMMERPAPSLLERGRAVLRSPRKLALLGGLGLAILLAGLLLGKRLARRP